MQILADFFSIKNNNNNNKRRREDFFPLDSVM